MRVHEIEKRFKNSDVPFYYLDHDVAGEGVNQYAFADRASLDAFLRDFLRAMAGELEQEDRETVLSHLKRGDFEDASTAIGEATGDSITWGRTMLQTYAGNGIDAMAQAVHDDGS